MSLQTYKRETLTGNWFEERAPPLAGSLPYDGVVPMETSFRTDFKKPRSYASHGTERRAHRMVTREFLDMVSKDTNDADDSWVGNIPRHVPGHGTRYFETTQSADFGYSKRSSQRSEKERLKQAAGGNRGGKLPLGEGEIRQGQAMGEVIRYGKDPQNNSAAQRSWLYGPDPGLTAHAGFATRKQRPHPTYMSLSIGKTGEMPKPGPRQSSEITRGGRGAPSRAAGVWSC